MKTKREKVSYCIGLESGKNIKEKFKDIDMEKLKKGFDDSIGEKTPELKQEEIHEILKMLQQQIQEQQRVFVEQISVKNKAEGEEFLEENKNQEGVEALPSGLQYKVLESGSGQSPSVYNEVTVHYRGTLINGKVFDSTYEKKEPQKFPMSRVIPGWTEALKMMKEGDKWQLFIPSYLAYGENGYGPIIEPNATLIFEMELLQVH